MSEQKKTAKTEAPVPAFVKAAPELLPVWDWWVKEGRSTLVTLAVVALAVGGFYAGRNWLQTRNAHANQALVNAFTTDELEAAVADYGSTKVGDSLRLRLAKSYFDAERYQDALDLYDTLVAKTAKDDPFAAVPRIGRAYALEGLANYAEAQKAFADFAADGANKDSYLLLTAQLGASRCKALAGDKAGAVKELDALKAASTNDAATARIDRMIDSVKRYDPTRVAARAFLPAATAATIEAAAQKAAEAKKDAEVKKPAEAKPADKPADAKKAEPVKSATVAPAAKPAADAKKAEPAKPAEAKK